MKFTKKEISLCKQIAEKYRKQIDLGIINEKQINKIVGEVAQSDINIIEMHILKVSKDLSVALNFLTKGEKDRFDAHSKKLVKELKKLNCPAAWMEAKK